MTTESRREGVIGTAFDLRLLRRLWKFVRPHKLLMLIGLGLIPLAAGFELLQPYLLKLAIDDHITTHQMNGFGTLMLAYVGLVLAQSLTMFGQLYAFQLLGQRTIHGIRQAIYDHVLGQRRAFFDHRPVGRLLTRMTNDVETINEIFTNGVITLVADFVKMVGIVATMFILDAKLTLLTFICLPFLAATVIYARNIMRSSFREIRAKLAAMNTFVQEHISGIKVLQLFLRERKAAKEYDQLNAGHRDAYLGAIKADATVYAVVEAIGVCAAAGIAWFAGANIATTGLTVGLIVAFIEYINKFFVPVRDLSAKYTVMQSAMAAAERIVDLLDTHEPDAPTAPARPSHPEERPGTIVFDHVHFAYREGDPVLNDITMHIEPGTTVAVVGATGSGKSTLIRLLARLYEPTSGEIRLGGVPLPTLDKEQLRDRLTVVSQDVFMFSGSVADNVRLGDPSASDDEIREAMARVGADAILSRRNADIDETVQERGGNFSAGERQLLAFARALIRDPEILILDEATAHVDPEAEELIEGAMRTLMQNRTSLVIAHRLSTIRRADVIVVLARGQIAEMGSHDQLVAEDGIYAQLERTFRQS
jgi:ATP-binding cassette subfamily B protein